MHSTNLQFTFLFFLLTFSLSAQVKDLPFATDWLTTTEQNEWTEYQIATTGFFDWSFSSTGFLSHDYPVGNTQADTVRDWMVSPVINFHSTSKMNLRLEVFAFIGLTDADYFGVWFSDGSKDPNDGDYQEIVELSDRFGISGGATGLQDTMGIEIPFTASEGYIAFVYETTNNWFTITVDSIAIVPDSALVNNENVLLEKEIKVFPNPASDFVTLSIAKDLSLDDYEVLVFNNLGQVVLSQSIDAHQTVLDLSAWSSGVYYYQVKGSHNVLKVGKVLLD